MAKLTPGHLQLYLRRVNYPDAAAPPAPTLKTLTSLHLAHVRNVPFENLALHLPHENGIDIRLPTVFDKLVIKRRGGYCFEMNSLFAAVLRTCGFAVQEGGARVLPSVPPAIPAVPMLNHQVLFVDVEGERFLADVGFGGKGPATPLRLHAEAEQLSVHSTYRLQPGTPMGGDAVATRDASSVNGSDISCGSKPLGWYLQVKEEGGRWRNLYYFQAASQQQVFAADFELMSHYMATFAGSPMRTTRMVCLHTLEGRTALLNDVLRVHTKSGVQEQVLANDDEVQEALKQHFGLNVWFKTAKRAEVTAEGTWH